MASRVSPLPGVSTRPYVNIRAFAQCIWVCHDHCALTCFLQEENDTKLGRLLVSLEKKINDMEVSATEAANL